MHLRKKLMMIVLGCALVTGCQQTKPADNEAKVTEAISVTPPSTPTIPQTLTEAVVTATPTPEEGLQGGQSIENLTPMISVEPPADLEPTDAPEPTETPEPTATLEPTATSTPEVKATPTTKPTVAITVTKIPTKVPTKAPTKAPTKVPAKPTATPTPGTFVTPDPSKGTTPQWTDGLLNENYHIRSAIGRDAPWIGTVPRGTRVKILKQYISEWNEIWYWATVTYNGSKVNCYIQGASVDKGLVPTPKHQTPLELVPMVAGDLNSHFGADKNGDGIYNVVFDPGHGGPFSGASYFGRHEKTLNLKVSSFTKQYLEEHYDNVVVSMTRTGDSVFEPRDDVDDLQYRVAYALNRNADLLVSMHFNATGSTRRASGAMVLVSKKSNVAKKSRELGNIILSELSKLGIKNLGCYKRSSYYSKYTDGTPMDGYLINRLGAERNLVSIIIEHCYMDNPVDCNFLNTDAKLKALAEADAKAIAKYLNLPPKGQGNTPTPIPTDTPVPTPTPTPMPTPEITPIPTEEPAPTEAPVPSPEPIATPTPMSTPEPSPVPTEAPMPTPEAAIDPEE